MAQNKEPAQQKLLGYLIAAVCLETTETGEVRLRVDVISRDPEDNPWEDTSIFRESDISLVAHATLRAYEWLWRQSVPAQSETSPSLEISGARTKSDRFNGRH